MDGHGTNRRRFMGGIAAGTIGLGLDRPRFFEQLEGLPEPPQTGTPPAGLFLAISGIEGGSTNVDHEDEIEILSWQLGMERPVDPKARKGAGGPAFDSLRCWKEMDKASPQLMASFATGNQHSEATLAVQVDFETVALDWLTIELNEAQITALTDLGTSNFAPVEAVAITYGEISVAVKEFDGTGAVQDTWEFGWSVG